MDVHEVMSVSVITVDPKTPFKKLWELIFKHSVHSLPVIDSKGKLVGMIVEQDLVRPLYPDYQDYIEDFGSATNFSEMEGKVKELKRLTADDVMCRRVVFTRRDTPAMRALSRMIVHRLRQLPVLSDADEVVGVISKSDVFRKLFDPGSKRINKSRRPTRSKPSTSRRTSSRKKPIEAK